MHLPIASAVQAIIEGVGVRYIEHVKRSYILRGWQYGQDITSTPGGRPCFGDERPLIPAPELDTSRYRFWGYHAGFGPTMACDPAPGDILILEDQVHELEKSLASVKQELAEKSQHIERLQLELVALRPPDISTSCPDLRHPDMSSSHPTLQGPNISSPHPSRAEPFEPQSTSTQLPSSFARTSWATATPSPSLSASGGPPSSQRAETALSQQAGPSNSPLSVQSISPSSSNTAFGRQTIRALWKALSVPADSSIHGQLRDISLECEEWEWEAMVSTVEGIGFEHSHDVARAMKEDSSTSKKN